MTVQASTIARFLTEAGERLTGTSVLALCSGGADSVALVEVMATLPRGHRPAAVTVLFLDHGLRDVRADRAAAEEVAHRHSLVFEERSAPAFEGSVQTEARDWRYAEATLVAQTIGANVVATGHHADDQAETLLAALVSTSGIRGAAGMKAGRELASGIRLVRPLLPLTRADIERLLDDAGLSWASDPSNADGSRFQRNAIRNAVVPGLVASHPAAGTNLVRTARRFAETDSALTALARHVIAGAVDADGALQLSEIESLPADARRVVLAEWLRSGGLGRAVTERVVTAVARLVDEPGSVDVRGARVVRERYRLVSVATDRDV